MQRAQRKGNPPPIAFLSVLFVLGIALPGTWLLLGDEGETSKDKTKEAKQPELPHIDSDKFDSGSKTLWLNMNNTDLGDVEVIDIPGDGDIVTFCWRGMRVWTDYNGGDASIEDDSDCKVGPKG